MESRPSFLPTLQAAVVLVLLFLVVGYLVKPEGPRDSSASTDPVGPFQSGPEVRHVTPDNHVLTPAGIQVELPGLRPNALALSPDGQLLVAAGTAARLVCVDPGTGRIRQEVALPAEDQVAPAAVSANILVQDPKAKLSFTGLIFSPDGRRLFLANVNGSIKVFAVGQDQNVTPSFTIPLPPAHATVRKAEIPAGLAISPDGRLLYVALNLSNGVAEVEIDSGKVLRRWEVGVAPFEVARVRDRLYVSNWGGRRPSAGAATGLAGQGVLIAIDALTSAAKEGSVSVIDLSAGKVVKELVTGRHASGLAVHPSGDYVGCACAADDFVAVIDTRKDEVVEKIWPKRTPADLFGASPNALTFSQDGKMLYVCNGTQNAVAVVEFEPGRSELEGLIPTAWYPGGVVFDPARQRLHVANLKGLGSWQRLAPGAPRKYISGNQFGTLSLIDLPASQAVLKQQTGTVLANVPAVPPCWRHSNGPVREDRPGPCRSGRANPPSSNTCCISSRKTAPTTRFSAICRRAMGIRRFVFTGKTSRRTSTA